MKEEEILENFLEYNDNIWNFQTVLLQHQVFKTKFQSDPMFLTEFIYFRIINGRIRFRE